MNYYISNGAFYTVPQRSDELYHHGVKGMKWGRRKIAKYESKIAANTSSANEYDLKAQRAMQRGRMKKAAKFTAKSEAYAAKVQKYKNKIAKVEKRAQKLLAAKTRVSDVSRATLNYGRNAANKAITSTKSAVSEQRARLRDATDQYINNAPKR